ncbi:MAG: hypothetical protein HGA71_15515 [Azonexaceae bacterium]|nr:hypothetical protein [Azonexaceae bacterium]
MKHHKSNIETGSKVVGIVRSTETVSLDLLQAVDATVANLADYTKIVDGLVSMLRTSIDDIKSVGVTEGEYIDPDDIAIDGMNRSLDQFKDRLAKMVLHRSEINKDCRLRDHHCETLHDSYDLAMTSVAEIIEVLSIARSEIIKHDLAAEPRCEHFATVEDLIASLHK